MSRSPSDGPDFRGRRLVALFGIAAALCVQGPACGRGEGVPGPVGSPAEDAPTPADTGRGYVIERLPAEKLLLTGAASGLDDLLRTVEQAFAERDSTRLQELMVSTPEFRDMLFPAFPAAHPPINAGFETVWVTHFPDAHRNLRRLLREYGGKHIRILDVRFETPRQDFVNFVLDETSHVDIEVNGKRRDDVQLFGSVFHVGDQYKVLSYPD